MITPFMVNKNALDWIAGILVIVGAVNWGLVGLFGVDLVGSIFGNMSFLSRAIYALVGLAAVYHGLQWKAIQRRWHMAPVRA